MKLFGELVQKGVDVVNFPISGLAGLAELISGEGIDKAVETIKSVQDEGFSKTLGARTFEETGSPLQATLAETFPTFVESLLGGGVAIKAGRKVTEGVTKGIDITRSAAEKLPLDINSLKLAAQDVKKLSTDIFQFQSPTKQRIAQAIKEGSTDIETARFKLDPSKSEKITDKPRTKIQEFLDIGGPKVKKDKVAIEAINQGFDEGVIATIKGANSVDKALMLEMVNIMEKGKKNALFAAKNRPSDVAGNVLMERFESVVDANKNSGRDLNKIANTLKGKSVDFDPAINTFIEGLGSLGVTLSNDLKPQFSGSTIEGITGAEKAITQIVNRMKSIKQPDGKKLHDLKKFIDEQVTFGKRTEGLSGRTINVLKTLRHNIDGILDNKFPEYDKVNTVFAETITAIDALQDVAGRKMDLQGVNAKKATGTLLRRLMGNTQSRVRLLDAVNEIESAAFKHGTAEINKSDILTQVLFADELDSVFGPVAKTSFQGQIDQAIKRGASGLTSKSGLVDIVATGLGKVVEKARGINQEGAFKSIKELLKEVTK